MPVPLGSGHWKWWGTLLSCHLSRGNYAKAAGRPRNYLPTQRRSVGVLEPRTQSSGNYSWFIEAQAETIAARPMEDPSAGR